MTTERWHQVDALFDAALNEAPHERQTFLDCACGSDRRLYHEVMHLLDSMEEAENRLGESAAHFIAPLLPNLATALEEHVAAGSAADTRIGPYRVIDEIGRGGMGVVYLVERTDGDEETLAALKRPRPGIDNDELLRRFYAERRIVASLDHEHIVWLLDVGADEKGRPYFVMEHVKGQPIDEYCDAHRLSLDKRLRLFIAACEAVHCAHRSRVLHCDLKPSNLLITSDGTLKLLDFGIATVLHEDCGSPALTRKTQHVMTPAYAAPEQLQGERLTTGTDIYALGVVLYQLLTGRHPREHDDPACTPVAHPSKVVTHPLARTRPDGTTDIVSPETVAKARRLRVDRLQGRLRGELDVILLKALRHEPERRYASVDALLKDIKNHVEGPPTPARRDRLSYRSTKRIRWHHFRGPAGATAMLLLVGMGATIWQAATAARRRHVSTRGRVKVTRQLASCRVPVAFLARSPRNLIPNPIRHVGMVEGAP